MNNNSDQIKASLGGQLRESLLSKIKPILENSDHIADTRVRLEIQACCLDLVTVLEDLINAHSLDRFVARN